MYRLSNGKLNDPTQLNCLDISLTPFNSFSSWRLKRQLK